MGGAPYIRFKQGGWADIRNINIVYTYYKACKAIHIVCDIVG